MRGLNEEANTWTEKTEANANSFSGRDGVAGIQIKNDGNQQERDYRAGSQRPKLTNLGAAINGGMLDQLIGQFSDQLAEQQRVIAQAQENIEKLSRRIQECKELKAELDKQLEQIENEN